MRDTVQPEACFSINLRISDLLVQLQNLFVFLFLVRDSLRLKKKNKVLKEPLKGARWSTYCLKKEGKIWAYQANTTDTLHRRGFPREVKGLQVSHWWGSIFHVSWRAAEGKEKVRHRLSLNCSCFSHPPPQQELFSATTQGPNFPTHPYAFCWISSLLLPPHTYLETLGNELLQFLILYSFPMIFSYLFSLKLCRQHY